MWVYVTTFWLPKAGNNDYEYEDAFYPDSEGGRKGKSLRFALADGASEGMLSREWAQILVKNFYMLRSRRGHLLNLLENSIRDWNSWLKDYHNKRENNNNPIKWYEEPGIQTGAFSTFLGITLLHKRNEYVGKWNAIAQGDTCLFQVRHDQLIQNFPIEKSTDFNNSPFLISSNQSLNGDLSETLDGITGDWLTDDVFYLMTDALALWFLREYESGGSPWQFLRDLGTQVIDQTFKNWIDGLRLEKLIRNDDVTLLRIEILGA